MDNSNSSTVIKVDSAVEEVPPLAEKTPNKKGNEEDNSNSSTVIKVDSAAEEVPPLAEKTPNKKGNEEDRADMTAKKNGKKPLDGEEDENEKTKGNEEDETDKTKGTEEDEAKNSSKKKGKRPLEGEEDVAAEKTAKKKRAYFRGLLFPYDPELDAPPPPGVAGDRSYYPSSSSALFSAKATFKKGVTPLDVVEKNTHLPLLQRYEAAIEPCSTSSDTESSSSDDSSDDSDDADDSEPTWEELTQKLIMLIRSRRNEQKKE